MGNKKLRSIHFHQVWDRFLQIYNIVETPNEMQMPIKKKHAIAVDSVPPKEYRMKSPGFQKFWTIYLIPKLLFCPASIIGFLPESLGGAVYGDLVARHVWNDCDRYTLETFYWSLLYTTALNVVSAFPEVSKYVDFSWSVTRHQHMLSYPIFCQLSYQQLKPWIHIHRVGDHRNVSLRIHHDKQKIEEASKVRQFSWPYFQLPESASLRSGNSYTVDAN